MTTNGSHRRYQNYEEELREQEVNTARSALWMQRRMSRVQMLVAVAAVVASAAAAFAALQAKSAVDAAEKGSIRQASEDQLSTAIAAIGGSSATERVAGFTLLRWNVTNTVESAARTGDATDRANAYALYATALDVLANYLRGAGTETGSATPAANGTPATVAHTGTNPSPAPTSTFGLGYGVPPASRDRTVPGGDAYYAADDLQYLLGLESDVKKLKPNAAADLGVDLAHVELWGQRWYDVRFDWLGGHFFPGIDLRAADLRDSRWGTSSLAGAYLQCADLSGADLRHTNLTGADLRGANLTGAKLQRANVTGADFEGATLTGVSMNGVIGSAGLIQAAAAPAAKWNLSVCEQNQNLWDTP